MRFLGLVVTTERRLEAYGKFQRELGRIDGERSGRTAGYAIGVAAGQMVSMLFPAKARKTKGAGHA